MAAGTTDGTSTGQWMLSLAAALPLWHLEMLSCCNCQHYQKRSFTVPAFWCHSSLFKIPGGCIWLSIVDLDHGPNCKRFWESKSLAFPGSLQKADSTSYQLIITEEILQICKGVSEARTGKVRKKLPLLPPFNTEFITDLMCSLEEQVWTLLHDFNEQSVK